MSNGPGPQRVCITTSPGELFVRSVHGGPEQWSLWLDLPLKAVAFLLGAAGHDAAIAQIAGAEAELVRAERAAEDRNPGSPEAASEREPGREQPEDEDGAMRTLIAGACHGGHYAGLGSAGYVTPPGGSSQRVRRFQRATSHPSRRCTRAQTRLPSTVPTIRATCGPP